MIELRTFINPTDFADIVNELDPRTLRCIVYAMQGVYHERIVELHMERSAYETQECFDEVEAPLEAVYEALQATSKAMIALDGDEGWEYR